MREVKAQLLLNRAKVIKIACFDQCRSDLLGHVDRMKRLLELLRADTVTQRTIRSP
jgi:hypothetical protein